MFAETLNKFSFTFHHVIGRGGFGQVIILDFKIAGVESGVEKNQASLRNERDVENKNYTQTFYCFSYEWT